MLYEYILIELQNLVTRKVLIQSVSLKNSTFFWYYMYLRVQLKYLVKWAVDLVHGGVETC